MAKAKKWYQSKTKLGALVGGLGAVLATVAPAIQADNSGAWAEAAPNLVTILGAVVAAWGARDAIQAKP